MRYRLGIDLGTNSIGWAVVELDSNDPPRPIKLLRLGVRIFSDGRNPKDGSSLAAQRRGPRQMRRRRDRYLRRRTRFMELLIRHGLMPQEPAARKALVTLDPYQLRRRGLDQALAPAEFARALFHLNQRRGFKSNRKTDRAAAKDSGKIKLALKAFREAMGDARSVGEALARKLDAGQSTRARLVGKGKDEHYSLYVDRQWILDEFDALWRSQRRFHPELLSDEAYADLKAVLEFQRPLRPVAVGRCFLEPSEPRAPAALPSSQRFRLLQELNHLRYFALVETQKELALNAVQRDELLAALALKPKLGFEALRKITFGANRDAYRFTIESERRKDLKGCDSAYKLSRPQAFGARWQSLSLAEQDEVVNLLQQTEHEGELSKLLIERYGLNADQAEHVCGLSLEDGHGRLSSVAIYKLLTQLEAGRGPSGELLTYDKAVLAAGYSSHTQEAGEQARAELPYYGEILWRYTLDAPLAKDAREREFGKIANPTVHIALNQLRKLVNTIIKRYGPPSGTVVELARELKASLEQKRRIREEQLANQDRNDAIREELAYQGVADNPENRLRYRLYSELGTTGVARLCTYTGRPIPLHKLFSNEFQIDHILPFSRTLDDGYANKILVARDANKYKGNKTPWEAFGHSPDGYRWEEILARVQALPRNKRVRFEPDAEARWLREEKDFLARQLTDTAYLARLARQYLQSVCPPHTVYVSPGKLTAMLRGKWGLDRILAAVDAHGELRPGKNRNDHRHHAIDAAVIAVTDRRLLQEVATLAGKARAADADRLLSGISTPWSDFRAEVESAVQRCVVSHKPDHGAEGALHNDTAYGIEDGPLEDGRYIVRHRVEIERLKPGDGAYIRCEPRVAERIAQALSEEDAKRRSESLAALATELRQRKVRYVEPMSVITVRPRGADGKPLTEAPPYKAYKGDSNYCYELFVNERGRWDGEIISTFRANQFAYRNFRQDLKRFRSQTFDGKKLVMRLCVGDCVAVEQEGQRRILRVVKMSEGQIVLAEHHEGGPLKKRDSDRSDSFKYLSKSPNALRELKARRVFVDLIGAVFDPGWRE